MSRDGVLAFMAKIAPGRPPALSKSARLGFGAYSGGRLVGVASWGWGIRPKHTAKKLFGPLADHRTYIELCRLRLSDDAPRNTASRFLGVMHRLLRRHTSYDVLYTYAAGFEGNIGHIYKAAGYEYFGRHPSTSAFLWVPGGGLVHSVSLWERYAQSCSTTSRRWQSIFPGSKVWCGYNFMYMKFLCDSARRAELLAACPFEPQAYPTMADCEIWTADHNGHREPVSLEQARKVRIVSLKSKRATSVGSDAPGDQPGEGGATPTVALGTGEGT